MIDLNEKSHSHDHLKIIDYQGLTCVKKIFFSDIERSKKNIMKQINFESINAGGINISSASTISFTQDSECLNLIMPYVDGITGDMLPTYLSKEAASRLSSALSSLLLLELNTSQEIHISKRIFVDKIIDVHGKTKDSELKKIIGESVDLIKKLPEQILFPMGSCHGDLTLSNIIFSPVSGIILIDFLETYLDSPIQDVVKLKQDFDYGWSFRHMSKPAQVKASIFCDKNYPLAIKQIERLYPMQVELMMLMVLARIAPYIKDETTKNWLVSSLKHCIINLTI